MPQHKYPARCSIAERNERTVANMGLIGAAVNRLSDCEVDALGGFEDAVQCGTFALMRASQLYDDTLGIAFSTYASQAVRHWLKRCVADAGLVRVPVYEFVRRLKAGEHLPTHVPFPEYTSLEGFVLPMEPKGRPEPEFDPWKHEELHAALAKLTPAEQSLIRLRFWEAKSLDEIGQPLGMSRQTTLNRIEAVLLKLHRLLEPTAPHGRRTGNHGRFAREKVT